MQGNYDRVAFIYDLLAKAVFGSSIQNAQIFLLQALPVNARILLVGGGTGWILEKIFQKHKSGLDITYVEISEKMILRAKKRNTGRNQITYLNKDIQDVKLKGSFDIIITPFLMDNFSEITLDKVFHQLDHHLNEGGLWLFSDFQLPKKSLGHMLLLKMMYLFFNFFCKLETSRLPDMAACFRQYGYAPLQQKTFYNNFIISIIYSKKKDAE